MLKRFSFVIIISLILFNLSQDEIYSHRNIVLGTSLPKTGISKEWGEAVLSGAKAYFNYANDKNILDDKKVHLVSYDDKYEPELTQENTKRLINIDKVFALFGFVGTPTVKKILPQLEDNKIPFLAPFTGASFLRETNNPNIINLRSSYKQEIEEIVKYLHTQKKFSKFAVFYQNDDYGEEAYTSLLQVLTRFNLKLIAEGTYKRNTLSISHALNEIKDAKPEAIILVGSYKANSEFIKRARKENTLKETIFTTISFGDANAMIKELNYETKNIVFSSVVPSYNDISIPIIKEYQDIYKKYYPKNEFSFNSLEAFLGAKLVVDALKSIEDKITKNRFLKAYKDSTTRSIQGININYKNHQLLNKIYLFEYKNRTFSEINYENK